MMGILEVAFQWTNGLDPLGILFKVWEILALGLVVGLTLVVGMTDNGEKWRDYFQYDEFPPIRPIRIPTKELGALGAIWLWLTGTRQWETTEDFRFSIDGREFFIPRGFRFDGASIPKYFRVWLSPMGILLTGAIVHDYLYQFGFLPTSRSSRGLQGISRKEVDKTFYRVCVSVNGLPVLSYIAYAAVRLGGWIHWLRYKETRGY